MSEKKVGKRLLTWVLVLVMTLSLLPLNVLAASPAVMRIVRPDTDKYITYNFYLTDEEEAEPYKSQIIKSGNSLTAPATPEKEGYQFTGWFYQNGTKFTDFETPISVTEGSTDVDLYAKFVPVCYVYFMDGTGEGARIIATKEVTATDPLNDFSDVAFPIGADEAITGWVDKDNNPVTSVSFSDGTTYLYPVVEKGHWIEFNSNGGSYVAPLFVAKNAQLSSLPEPTKHGYSFDSWYTDKEMTNKFESDNDLSDDLTLYAKWNPSSNVSYTVIHWLENADDDNYSLAASESKSGITGSKTEATAKTYVGFTSPAAKDIEQETIAGDGSTIVNVYYKRNMYEVKFSSYSYTDWRGHSHPGTEYTSLRITAKYGANISDKWPTYNGSSTWSTNDNENKGPYQVNIQTMPLGGANFYGPKTGRGSETAYYYVESLTGGKYELHHSDTTPGTGYSVTDEDRYSITGFTFKTYTAEQGGNWFDGYYEKYDGARFYYTRNSYNIVFINGGAEDKTLSKKYQQDISDANYTPTAPAGKEGYEFAGWFDNELCEGTAYNFTGKTMPANNITLYAKWVEPVHTVTFMVGETTYETIPDVAHKGTITLPAAPKAPDGDTFLGWVDATRKPFHPSTKITGDLTLYAKFGNKAGYSVTYVTEGSSPVTDDKLYAEDAYATVLNGPSTAPAGKVFLYWNASSDSSGKKYYPNDKVLVPKGGVTLTAVYGPVAQVLTLTYHSNYPDGTDTTAVEPNLKNNERITVAASNKFSPPNGYKFDGWNTQANGLGTKFAAGSSARVDNIGSNDLYAQWKPIQITDEITVTIKGNTSTVTYDGTEKSVTGYTVERSDNRYTENDFTFSGTALAKGTDAGTYNMGLNAGQFTNTNTNFTNVTFVISTDGELKIEPRKVTLTSGSGSKVYDGKPLTKPEVTCEDAVFKSEVTEIKATGSITDFGEVTNTITYNEGANFKADNYEITTTEGKLTITKRSVTLTSETANKVYDGTPLTKPEVTVTGDGFVTGEVTDIKATGTVTNVGEVTNTITYNEGTNFKADNYEITTTEGKLTITKRPVTLTSASDSKVYDGTALTKPEVTVTGSFVDGEVTDIKATGTITDVGTVTNTITFAKGEKFKDSNYAITKTEGTLEVTPITDKVTVTITGNTKTVRYNGKEQSVTGFTYTAPEGVTVTLNAGSKAEAKGTDKGTYYMDLTKGDFIVSSKIYKEFEIIVKDGYLEITRSGGHHPRPKPTVEIEDDDALGLNTTDHFAYIVGYGNGEVRPQNNITRAEVATIFFRLLTDDVRDENLTKTNRYSDVTRADWYNTAVSTLSSMGIITGYPDGTFRPNAAITRAEFAAIAARFDHDGDKTAAKFSDIASHWAKDEISIAYNNGWITGYPNGTFGPQRDITRAETMTLVNRVLNRQPETEDDLLPNMVTWTDNANPKAWYYLAVQEATNSHYYKFKTNSKYEKWTELRETRDWTLLEK